MAHVVHFKNAFTTAIKSDSVANKTFYIKSEAHTINRSQNTLYYVYWRELVARRRHLSFFLGAARKAAAVRFQIVG
jgi:hypothetical protein